MSEAVATGGATRSKAPVHLWIVGFLALLWNGYGAFDYLATVFRWEPYMSNFPQDQLDYFYGFPTWMYVIWAIGTLGGLLGAVGLLLRKRWAAPMLGLSLLGAVVSMIVSFFMEEPPESLGGPAAIIFPIVIIAIAFGLYYYARRMAAKGVLR